MGDISLKRWLKRVIPTSWLNRWLHRCDKKKGGIFYRGDFNSWHDAAKLASGYGVPVILERTRDSLRMVRDGKAEFERDSVIISPPEYPFALIACLLHLAALKELKSLSVLDFGGSLGSSYFQCRKFLVGVKKLRWSVIEQTAHVACGRAEFQNDELRFYETISEAMASERPDVLVLSGVLQCLPEPFAVLEELRAQTIPFMILDRLPFINAGRDLLTLQEVPETIYPASYPAWFFAAGKVENFVGQTHELITPFPYGFVARTAIGSAFQTGFFLKKRAHEFAPHFCTYFDHRYLTRGMALAASLHTHCSAAVLWVLCLTPDCHAAMTRLALPGVRLLSMEDFENRHPRLAAVKAQRQPLEYYYTCTPFLPAHVLRENPGIASVTYLDADMFFFDTPEPVLRATEEASIVLSPHRFPPSRKGCERFGVFNVGWIGLRNDEDALAMLDWWATQCVEWCEEHVEPNRYADQKYLDEVPNRFCNVHLLDNPGVNAAIWNLGNLTAETFNGRVRLSGEPLVCFHFHYFRQHRSWLLETSARTWDCRVTRVMKRGIFTPYLRALAAQRKLLMNANLTEALAYERLPRPDGSAQLGTSRCLLHTLKLAAQGRLMLCMNHRIL